VNTNDATLVWQKSQRCDNAACVEVATLATGVALRDSSIPGGPVLTFSKHDWASFVAGLRAGRRPGA
jgi:hypothetical protein